LFTLLPNPPHHSQLPIDLLLAALSELGMEELALIKLS
jgi:hypothetical protein